MRALMEVNIPKFVFDDVPLFYGLVSDLFPELDPEVSENERFKAATERVLAARKYAIVPDQVHKVKQLADTMASRHTTMVVGPTSGGKTVIIEALRDAQTYLKLPTKLSVINAKAITVDELYGKLDENTRDWEDGLLSRIFREINESHAHSDLGPAAPAGGAGTASGDALDSSVMGPGASAGASAMGSSLGVSGGVSNEPTVQRYIVFDGDVDAKWVENMNSVMDDNKILTLPNSERIPLQDHCKLLFEVSDLQARYFRFHP